MKRRGFISLIFLAGTVAALLYYGAVWLVIERIKTMPDSPPNMEINEK